MQEYRNKVIKKIISADDESSIKEIVLNSLLQLRDNNVHEFIIQERYIDKMITQLTLIMESRFSNIEKQNIEKAIERFKRMSIKNLPSNK